MLFQCFFPESTNPMGWSSVAFVSEPGLLEKNPSLFIEKNIREKSENPSKNMENRWTITIFSGKTDGQSSFLVENSDKTTGKWENHGNIPVLLIDQTADFTSQFHQCIAIDASSGIDTPWLL